MEVVNTVYILRLHSLLVHQRPVERDVFVYVLYLLYEFFGLESAYLLRIHRFDLFLIVSFFFHYLSSCSPSAERERFLVHFNEFRGYGVFNGVKPLFLRKVKII